jgi:hypothetical protein
MRVRFRWTQPEWTEAVSLANRRKVTHKSSISDLTWVLIAIPLAGAGFELLKSLRSRESAPADVLLPLLLLILAVVVAGILIAARHQRLYRMLQHAAMPSTECEAVLQEAGWSIRETLTAPMAESRLRAWSDLREARRGQHVLVLLETDTFEALPLNGLTPDQDGHLQRLLSRKLRPATSINKGSLP